MIQTELLNTILYLSGDIGENDHLLWLEIMFVLSVKGDFVCFNVPISLDIIYFIIWSLFY